MLATRPQPRAVLDLGCGSGVVGVVLATLLGSATRVCASDLSEAAVRLARHNAARNGVAIECERGGLFEPWVETGERFDLIVDDVPLARLSGWYPAGVPSDTGRDGTRLITAVLDQAPEHLAPGGRLVFPVLTLSREEAVLGRARAAFDAVEQLEEQWYPLGEELVAQFPEVEQLAAEGSVRIAKRGSRWCWATRIVVAYRR